MGVCEFMKAKGDAYVLWLSWLLRVSEEACESLCCPWLVVVTLMGECPNREIGLELAMTILGKNVRGKKE